MCSAIPANHIPIPTNHIPTASDETNILRFHIAILKVKKEMMRTVMCEGW
jgi:hypothetical protein